MEATIFKTETKRGQEWVEFALEVLKHIDLYTVPQYGDLPDDKVASFTPEQIVSSIERYCARFGKNSREGQDQLDLKKIAHYAAILSNKIETRENYIHIAHGKDDAINWINDTLRRKDDFNYSIDLKIYPKK